MSTADPASTLSVSVEPLRDRTGLEREWRALEAVADAGFFLGWAWIGTLLSSLPAELQPQVLRVRGDDRLVGAGLFWTRAQRRHAIVRSRTMHLNETGLAEFDRVTIEHNGLLAEPDRIAEVTSAAVAALARRPGWDEVALGGLGATQREAWRSAAERQGFALRVLWEKPSFHVDLDRIRAGQAGYLDTLSANSRAQIRRAMRLQAQRGPLVCELATEASTAQEWLEALIGFHQARWSARGHDGAFGSEFTRRFHHRLVSDGVSAGRVWMTRLRAGDHVIGYLYNLQHGGVVYNYQSGHAPETDPKAKAGLVCHVLAIEDALARGCRTYDLMMGGGHFKSSLCNDSGSMVWATLQRPRLSFRLEAWLRSVRDTFAPADKEATA